MKLYQASLHLLVIFVSLITTSVAIPKYAKTRCNDTCGNVTIPFPFGIGADCSINRWYTIDCNSSTPYLSALNHLQVLGVNLVDQTVTVNTPRISDCQNNKFLRNLTTSIDLSKTPFLFSKSHNKFVFVGCGNAVMKDKFARVVTGCSTYCPNNTVSERNMCYGIRCCQTTIPYYLDSYLTGFEGDGECQDGFLLDEKYHVRSSSFAKMGFDPVSLMWTLTSDTILCCDVAHYIRDLELKMGNNNSVLSQKCSLDMRYVGNPYLFDGCEEREECARCNYSYLTGASYCSFDTIYEDDGSSRLTNFTCGAYHFDGDKASMVTDICINMGILLSMATAYVLYKCIKKTKAKRQRKRFFKRNGGLLLKQQQEADPSLIGKTIHFKSRDLDKATDNFNENRILGRGGQGTVYKGMLVDGRIVAIKKSIGVDENQLEQFINEVIILSQINHRNVVKLLGCCLETDVPLLVSEFIPNGTLYDYLHNKANEFPMSLNMRLQIATEIVGALAYLHSATSIPIYHRDIKTTNILLDDKYKAKVSDFGTSRFFSLKQTHLTTLVKGTFGYLDPEYFQSSQFTEKSDVYSFGVVLVELLTGEKPIFVNSFGESISLAAHFMLAMEEGRVMYIFDAGVIKEGTMDELMLLANLAMRCLNWNGKFRPTMKEVSIELEAIRISHITSTIQTNTNPTCTGREC